MLSVLSKLAFSTRVSKGLVHFVGIKLWQHVYFWGAGERKLVIKPQSCLHCSGKDPFALLRGLPCNGVLNVRFKYRMKTLG